jgi:hypothetical protein
MTQQRGHWRSGKRNTDEHHDGHRNLFDEGGGERGIKKM